MNGLVFPTCSTSMGKVAPPQCLQRAGGTDWVVSLLKEPVLSLQHPTLYAGPACCLHASFLSLAGSGALARHSPNCKLLPCRYIRWSQGMASIPPSYSPGTAIMRLQGLPQTTPVNVVLRGLRGKRRFHFKAHVQPAYTYVASISFEHPPYNVLQMV